MERNLSAALVYPHQLWRNHPAASHVDTVILVEDPLFFTQFRFHAQKLVLHRASMSEFLGFYRKQGKSVYRIEASQLKNTSDIGPLLQNMGIKGVKVVEPTDVWLRQGIVRGCKKCDIEIEWCTDSSFFTSREIIEEWAQTQKSFYFTNFYIQQRKRLNILLDKHKKPLGGKWTFDVENRKKLPKGISIPGIECLDERQSVKEAREYVEANFPEALGEIHPFLYPVTFEDSQEWLTTFITKRLRRFGDYEDAISSQEAFLFHSVLTPILNIGLLTPEEICQAAIENSQDVPLNSLEGFIRQVIGWREFVRLVYCAVGSTQRTANSWDFSLALPESFYTGSTGVIPFDNSIKKVLKFGYCHHIERLMVLGNFMLLCEIAPDQVYQWFMEMFVDSYDWVMVPNIYGMSQHADGGLMTTKPYISGSSYILRMSNYKKGTWCEIWDALYWRFIDRQREFFSKNPRMRVMTAQLDKMGSNRERHLRIADDFLRSLHGK